MKRVVYAGGFHTTNVGNAFYSMGIRYLLSFLNKEEYEVIYTSDRPGYAWTDYTKTRSEKHFFDYIRCLKPIDYFILAGPLLSKKSLLMWERDIKDMISSGTKIILLSAGGSQYTADEIDFVKDFLSKNRLFALITRDRYTYESYCSFFEYSYDGICCAFYIPDYYRASSMSTPFLVMNFEGINEPIIPNLEDTLAIWLEEKKDYVLSNSFREKICSGEYSIVRTKHTCFSPKKRYKDDNVYISDVPEDFLNIYSNAIITYTDRVHAAVATIAQGGAAQLYTNTPRAFLFDRIGLGDIRSKVVAADMDYLNKERAKQKAFFLDLF